MDEELVQQEARNFLKKINPKSLPVSVESYAEAANASIKFEDLAENEAGCSFKLKGRNYISINKNDRLTRQRFTICHEIAHIVLDLPSEHSELPPWSFAKRHENEILCDIFATELLLPFHLLKPKLKSLEPSFDLLEKLSNDFSVSLSAMGSRYAALADFPCAFVISDKGIIKYGSRSTPLRTSGAWIAPRRPLPAGSRAKLLRGGGAEISAVEISQDIWFEDWSSTDYMWEEARHYKKYDQTLSLLWIDEEEIQDRRTYVRERADEELGLKELTGELPWPSGKKRR